MSTLRDDVYSEICDIINIALNTNSVPHDNICDELGDYFDDVESSNDAVLQAAYEKARDAHEEDDDVALRLLQEAKAMLEA